MPSSLLSHQGILLPLWIRYPDKFDVVALCVGSFAPDLAFYLPDMAAQLHSLGGLLITVPVGLILVLLFSKVLLPTVATSTANGQFGIISKCLAYFGVDDLQYLKKQKVSFDWLVKATYSVLIGIFSHFLLDLPSHGLIPYLRPFYDGMMPQWFLQEHFKIELPFRQLELTNYNILWLLLSVILGIATLYCMRYIKKHRLLPG